jgi:hypothetical protein
MQQFKIRASELRINRGFVGNIELSGFTFDITGCVFTFSVKQRPDTPLVIFKEWNTHTSLYTTNLRFNSGDLNTPGEFAYNLKITFPSGDVLQSDNGKIIIEEVVS